ncbi:MAG: CvpA family protein [Proteobacteria bacterium]|nr:CvpA family protein [Pseudomonadota bacterium]
MWLDALALGILALFIGVGAWRGALASGLGIVSLALGYVGAVAGAKHFGAGTAETLGVPALLGPPIAGSLVFLVVLVTVGTLGGLLQSRARRRRGDEPRSGVDRLLGASFGALRGLLVVLLVAWGAVWVDAGSELGALENMPRVENSAAAAASQDVVEVAVRAALPDDSAASRLAARLAARPATTLKSMQSLLDDSRIQAVQSDGFFWTLVENGNVEGALNRLSFQNVIHDKALRTELADMGLISPEAGESASVFRDDVAKVMAEVGPRVKGLKNDPAFQRLARNPEIVALLENGDTLALLQHPDFQKLVSRVTSEL